MDILERAIETVKKPDSEKLGNGLLQKAKVLAWETGLGPVMNALPGTFGQQAVLYFPGHSGKYSFPCYEYNGSILLALTSDELESVRDQLLQNPGVEVWLKSGWFTGTVRMLSEAERSAVIDAIPAEKFFGNALGSLSGHSLTDYSLLEMTRNAPCTGSSGPGSKAWVWPLAACLLLFSKKGKHR